MLIPVWNPPHQLIDESETSPQLVDNKNKSEIEIDVGSESKNEDTNDNTISNNELADDIENVFSDGESSNININDIPPNHTSGLYKTGRYELDENAAVEFDEFIKYLEENYPSLISEGKIKKHEKTKFESEFTKVKHNYKDVMKKLKERRKNVE